MKIIVDANIIYSNALIQDRLPSGLNSFLKICAEKNHDIIITLTTKLEFDRKQAELRRLKIQELKNASILLQIHKIGFKDFNAEKIIIAPDLLALIKEQKVNIHFIEPDLENFKYAHEKACLHLSPHPPDIKTDEMRDLIVWSIALNTAIQYKGALLISNDQLHIHERGDEEALSVGLIRLNSLETALEYMEVETPNGKIISALLDKAWDKLLEVGLPLKDKPTLKGISNVRIVQGKFAPAEVYFGMKVVGKDSKELSSDVKIIIESNLLKSITLEDIFYDNKNIQKTQIELNMEIDLFENDYDQRLNSLKGNLK